jgi:hypothetical protein
MPSPQFNASVITDPFVIEEIRTTLYVDSARLKVLSQETTVHPADNDNLAETLPQG